MRLAMALLSVAALMLAACAKQVEVPYDKGVCWAMSQPAGKPVFHKVAVNIDTVEKCAIELETMRLRFLGLGGGSDTIIGGYQGQFLFLLPEGIFIGATLKGGRYLLLVRSGDGRLVKPGVMPVE